jgi:hypothetical protein
MITSCPTVPHNLDISWDSATKCITYHSKPTSDAKTKPHIMALTSSLPKTTIFPKIKIADDHNNGNTESQNTNKNTDDENMDIKHIFATDKKIKTTMNLLIITTLTITMIKMIKI